VVRKM